VVDIEKVKDRAEQLRSEVEQAMDRAEQLKAEIEQAMGRAMESMESTETQARGIVDEAKGKALETVAEFKGEVTKGAGDVQEQLAEISGKARKAVIELSPSSIALAVAGVVVVLALVGAWFRARRAARAAPRGSEA